MAETLHGLHIKLTCDGVILGGNPGGDCYGSWIVEVNGKPVQSVRRLEFLDASTNNEAEYEALLGGLRSIVNLFSDEVVGHSHALLGGLRSIVNLFSDEVVGHSHLDIVTDSQLMQQQVLGLWKCKAANLKTLLSHVDALLSRFATFRVLWVPREDMVKEVGH
jgi:ribonuclease HI